MSYTRRIPTALFSCLLLIAGGGLGCSGPGDASDGHYGEQLGTGATGAGGAASGGSDGGGDSGGSNSSGGGSGGDGSGGDGSGGDGSGGDGSGGTNTSIEDYEGGPCPSEAPTPGAECETGGGLCTYGDTELPGCRQAFSCYPNGENGSWVVDTSPADGCPVVSGPCSTATEGPCDQVRLTCHSGAELCTCSPEQTQTCGGDGCTPIDPPIPQQWSCSVPYVEPGCPISPPNAGSQCTDLTFNCRYGADCSGIYAVCRDGYHKWEDALCP